MNQKPLKKFFLFLISGIVLTTVTVLACAGGDWDGTEGSMFSPDIIGQEKYKPFFRTVATPFYGGYDDESSYRFGDMNISEWNESYFSKALSNQALNYWLHIASLNQIDSMIFAIKDKPSHLSEKSKEFTLKGIQPASKATAFLYYLGFAKRNEDFAVETVTYWDEPKKVSTVSIDKQITGGLSFYNKATDPFLKERYAFQVIRSYYFNKDYDKAISFYDSNVSVFKSGNSMKWRALGYKAASLYKQKKFAESNYIYSRIYAEYEFLNKSAFLSFHPQTVTELSTCLALAKNNEEKEVIWQLQGLYTNYVVAMKEILKINPKSDNVDVLLVRAINIEEEKVNGILVSNEKEQKEMLASTDKDLLKFLNEMSESNASQNPAMWHLAAAYLNYIHKDFVLGDKQLKRAEKPSKSTTLLTAQYHLISLIGKINRLTEINDKAEADLLTDLKMLYAGEGGKDPENFRGIYAREWFRTCLAGLYLKKGEIEKAELIRPGKNNIRFENTENIKNMIAYFDKAKKTDFEKVFFDVAVYQRGDYVELLGIRYAQQDKLTEALATLKTIPAYDITLYGNPFTIHIKDCHECDHGAIQKTKYTSVSFIEKMIEMKNTAIAKPSEAAQNYFLVANGFYNMTYFGNARYFYENNVSGDLYYYGRHEMLPEEHCEIALKYYLLAKEKSTDIEFRAKCTFMAAKCEQNLFFVNIPEDYKGDFKAGIYFSSLKKDFATTKYYKEIIKECGYFRTYLGR